MSEQVMDDLMTVESTTPYWLKRTVMVVGLITAIIGAPFALNLLCIVPLVLFNTSDRDAIAYGVASLTFALLTVGAGFVAYWHGNRALKNIPSKPLRFSTHPMLFVGIFVFLLGLGSAILAVRNGIGLFFPPILLLAAALPPIWSVAWMIPYSFGSKHNGEGDELPDTEQALNDENKPFLSWRRGLLAFAGGATVSVVIAIVLEILLPVIILSLVFNLADTVMDNLSVLFRELSNQNVADALTNRGFIYLFLQFAIIAPFAEELAKPLVVLPLVCRLGKQETFWIGALAGAGFAALENVIYATSGLSIWAGIVIVRALGGALHPLGSGLVALGWRDVLRGEKDAGRNWWKQFGIAVAIHAAWNGGSLLVITLGGARFFGDMPPQIDILGLSAAGTTLAFLIILGLTALWIGRAYGHDKLVLPVEGGEREETRLIPSDRAVALWAVACLIVIVPAGIAGLKLWLR